MHKLVKFCIDCIDVRTQNQADNAKNALVLNFYKAIQGSNETGTGQRFLRRRIGENIISGIRNSQPGDKDAQPVGLQGEGGI